MKKSFRILSLLMILVMSISLVGCGFDARDVKRAIKTPGKDFRNSKFGDSMTLVKAKEKNKHPLEYGPEGLTEMPQMSTWNSLFVQQKDMHVILYDKADIGGVEAELGYVFFNDHFGLGIAAFGKLSKEETEELYNLLKKDYDKLYGNPTAIDAQSAIYMSGNRWVVLAYDGNLNLGVMLADASYFR